MKVCHLISGDLWAGAEVQAYSVMSALATCPEVELSAIILNGGRLARELKNAGIQTTVIDESRHGFREILRLAAGILTDRKVEILHSHRYKENVLAALLKKRCGINRLVQTVHGSPEHTIGVKGLKARAYSMLNQHFSQKFDRIISVSFDLSKRLNNQFDPAKIVTIHNAVELSRLAPTKSREDLKAELGLATDCQTIGLVGRLVPVKGIERFLDCAQKIKRKRPQTIFLIVGDGPLFDEYKQSAEDLGLGGEVVMTGFREDVVDIINCLDIFVMTSHHEGIPMTLLEAFALKRPVAAMKVGGIPEVVENGVSGILVDSGDVEGLASACVELLGDPSRAARMGESARSRLESEFSMEVCRGRILEVYRSLMG